MTDLDLEPDPAVVELDALIAQWRCTDDDRPLWEFLDVPEPMYAAWTEDRISAAQLLAFRTVTQ